MLAVGAVMVYSASSAESLLQRHGGDPAFYLKRYVILGLIGLVGHALVSRARAGRGEAADAGAARRRRSC